MQILHAKRLILYFIGRQKNETFKFQEKQKLEQVELYKSPLSVRWSRSTAK